MQALITALLNRKVLEPITKLSEAMKDVSQGDFDKQLETSSRIAEVAQSYNSFNVMTKELRATEVLQMDFVSKFLMSLRPLSMPLKVIQCFFREKNYRRSKRDM